MNRLRMRTTNPLKAEWPDQVLFEMIPHTGETILLLNAPLDVLEIVSWLKQNEHAIRTESPPFLQRPDGSIARTIHAQRQALRDLPVDDDESIDRLHDTLYSYCLRHSVRFAARGFDIPDVFLGLREGCGEISCYEPGKGIDWAYRFDLDDFFGSLPAES